MVFLLAVSVAVEIFLFESKYEYRIYPNIFVGNVNIGGTTSDDAERLLGEKINKMGEEGIPLSLDTKATSLPLTVDSFGADLAYDIISFDTKKTIEDAYDIGRSDNYLADLFTKVNLILNKKNIKMHYDVNTEQAKKLVKEKFPEAEFPYQDAELDIKDGKVSVIKEKNGQEIDYDAFFPVLRSKLDSLDQTPIVLGVKTINPKILESAFADNNSAELVQQILDLAPIDLTYQGKKWSINKDVFKGWILLKADYAFCSTSGIAVLADSKYSKVVGNDVADRINETCADNSNMGSAIKVGFGKDAVLKYFSKNISPKLDVNPYNSRFEMQGGKVSQFKVGSQGQKIDPDKNFILMEYLIAYKKNKKLELAVDKIESEVDSIEQINDLGITEIIGTGKSNFAGSPSNRRHNIKTGGSSLHGILIKPGEEFSLIKALGKIDGSTGYLPELVIKNNKTTPEYGGGLCQIGTTMFRAALASGLPITARTNHSYRVSYYEPAGTDATIYDPWPDFRFQNDTGNYILVQMRISGNNLAFDFWGKKDGRKVVQTKPTIYNLVKPAPTKTIETTDLKPGEKKCTEKAHTGADAYFDYKITYSDGSVKEKRFNSHYKPWQAVCLLGVKKLTTPPADTTEKSTTSNTSTSTKNTSTQ